MKVTSMGTFRRVFMGGDDIPIIRAHQGLLYPTPTFVSHMKPSPIKCNYLAIFSSFYTKSLPTLQEIGVRGCAWVRWTALI